MSRIGALLAGLVLLISPATAAAQDLFAGIPDLADHGVVDGWRAGKIDSDDIWLGQACVLYKTLTKDPSPIYVTYRFEPGEEETAVVFAVPRAESVPDPDEIDWGYLEPADLIYALNGTDARRAPGHVGWEYIDANSVYVTLSMDADRAMVDQIAAADWVGIAVDGAAEGMRFDTGKATGAVAWARQCLAGFN
ncbi:hypothetical protein BBF93_14810 [Hyphomonas sp. CACIAM 19H1]|uniref:hypothetical protein n=1 Tax=Hyphomonas sp. CACIAM 19H1 TaxID=1873716 RepID=UPI000DED404C|nr:hypothetical protein [Hyphomonas sp. CACIAM 19H1]AXE65351.1 hypothetical protein BBF93_14810 [Hyphomonas sp. CACIAM 19H1]